MRMCSCLAAKTGLVALYAPNFTGLAGLCRHVIVHFMASLIWPIPMEEPEAPICIRVGTVCMSIAQFASPLNAFGLLCGKLISVRAACGTSSRAGGAHLCYRIQQSFCASLIDRGRAWLRCLHSHLLSTAC
jgi:hypothetical protein